MIIIILYIPANRVRDTSPKAISLICTILLAIHDNNNYICIAMRKHYYLVEWRRGIYDSLPRFCRQRDRQYPTVVRKLPMKVFLVLRKILAAIRWTEVCVYVKRIIM